MVDLFLNFLNFSTWGRVKMVDVMIFFDFSTFRPGEVGPNSGFYTNVFDFSTFRPGGE